MKRGVVWHYTTGEKLNLIISTRALRPTSAEIADGELPALWFSKEQIWEPTAQKAWRELGGRTVLLGMRGTYERAGLRSNRGRP
jgi:hypothetical protein